MTETKRPEFAIEIAATEPPEFNPQAGSHTIMEPGWKIILLSK